MNFSVYKKDINKRKQNQIILTQIYTPSFTPHIHTKKENVKRNRNINKNEINHNHSQRFRNNNHIYNDEMDDSDNDDDFYKNSQENMYDDEYVEDEEKSFGGKYKKASNS